MRNIFKLVCLLGVLTFSSCDDFFNTDPDNIINVDDYISRNDEVYKGFMGILTRMQEAGDHAIFLTDTRGDYMETTPNTPIELQDIYNYNETDGNEYADPTCYYAIIIACNDFIDKLQVFRKEKEGSLDDRTEVHYDALASSALRIKVWAYYTLGRIYGKAVWFDSPLEKMENLDNTEIFTWLNDMPSIVDACLNLLDKGVVMNGKTIAANLEMDWIAYLDPENQSETSYVKWLYLVPNYVLLRSELLSWRGTQADWLWIRDNILEYLYLQHTSTTTSLTSPEFIYSCGIPLTGNYYRIFYTEEVGYRYQLVTGIVYDYKNDQQNRLVEYFCPGYPGGGYYLRPSDYATGKYIEEDIRGLTQRLIMNRINGEVCFTKNFYHRGSYLRSKIFEIAPTIVIQRGHDFHFLLSEAENHLGNWRQSECILNQGLTNEFPYFSSIPEDWSRYYETWFAPNGGYGDIGIVGCVRGKNHELPKPSDPNYNVTEEERQRLYDMALLDEYLLEYTGEGKSYSYMIKMALRYGDPSIISDRVCPKYPDGKQGHIRAAIEAGGYWVDWNLRGDND